MADRAAPSRGDVLVGVATTVVLLIELAGELDDGLERPLLGIALSAAMGAALTTRRRAPLASYIVSSAALAAQATFVFVGGTYPFVNLASIYAAGEHGGRRSWVSIPVALAGITAYFVRADEPDLLPALVSLLWIAAWFSGLQIGRLHEEEDRRRDDQARVAVAEERGRLARDLHDQVGHAVTVMLVHAGAARQVLDRDPARARDSLEAIEEVGRRTMVDLDALLGALRAGEDRVDEHVNTVRGLGLEVDVHREGRVPDALLGTVGRIVQEGLTNVVRHAQAQHALVDVRADGRVVVVSVQDDGSGGEVVTGRGLRGMRERVADLGGSLEVGPAPDGGTRLVARLPVGDSA